MGRRYRDDSDAARVVVLVEDDDGLRHALDRMLRAAGFEVLNFGNAEDALVACGQHSVHCLVVDLNLPAMSGVDLIDQLQSVGIRTPVIIISAQDSERVRANAMQRGAMGFLTKPVAGNVLVAAVDVVCGTPGATAPKGTPGCP